MSKIANIHGREILDSRGQPTVEVDVILESGTTGRFAVPSGASTGEHEALELRDGDSKRFRGKGVRIAVGHVNDVLARELIGMDANRQEDIDQKMIAIDGTQNKERLGANAILGISVACAKAAAAEKKMPLFRYFEGVGPYMMPVPLMNVLNGGAHADNGLDIQEFMIVPLRAPSFAEALRMGAEVFYALKELLHQKGLSTNVGDEGGFAPNLTKNIEALDLLMKAVERAGFRCGEDVFLALDAAASEFFDKQSQVYRIEGQSLSSSDLINYWNELCLRYPILSIEDPLDQNDWNGWKKLTRELSKKVQLVGDDLFVTNVTILERGIAAHVASAVLIKLNQIGTLSETKKAVQVAQAAGYKTIISHRSGETEDTTISHLAVGWMAGQIKTGSLSRSDRTAKYNELLRIEESLADRAQYAGMHWS